VLTIYGATGYTGRLCAHEAVRCRIPLRIAGRRRDALEALAAELGTPVRVAVADATDPRSLTALAQSSDVLITTVGPYLRLGLQVLEAALAGGSHYLDVSGEVPFLERVHRQQERARDAGIAVCPGFGFDGVPGELLAGIAARELDGPVSSVRVAYAVDGGAPSGGTVRSALGIAARGGAAWIGGALVEEPVGADRWDAPLPGGTRATLSAPLPEAVTVGRSTGADLVRAYVATPAAAALHAVAKPAGALLRGFARTPAWALLERAAGGLPAGPGPGRRARATAAVLARVDGADGAAVAWARMSDPYQLTARIAVDVAARLLDGRIDRAGVLTPSQALAEDAGSFLTSIGVDWGRR